MDILGKLKSLVSPSPKQEEKKKDRSAYSVLNLQNSKNSSDLLDAHLSVQTYFLPWMSAREYYYDFTHPDTQWTPEEKQVLARKKKAAIAFNRLKSSERAYIGSLIQQKYDIKPAPVEPSDQDISDVISALYSYTAYNEMVRIKDVGMIRDAWIGGDSWQESYIEMYPGKKPKICVMNQNNFAIYPDPNRRDLVANSDCRFIDRVGWYDPDQLISIYPEKEREIRAGLQAPTRIDYQMDKPWADRQHEYFEQKNGRFKVVERFYKVSKRNWSAMGDDLDEPEHVGYDVDVESREDYAQNNPGRKLYSVPEEFLYLAVVCSSMEGYLYNGPYHAQPRNPKTGKIMFTLIELIDEDVGGIPCGHIEHMVGPQKVINSMAANTLAQAKAASGVSHIVSPKYFDEAGIDDLTNNLSDGPRTFVTRKDMEAGGISLVPQGAVGPDTQKSMDFATTVLEDNSSTPPAMKGYVESSGTPASLNEQRIQQSFTQSQVQVTNYMNFLTQRAILWMAYWFQFYDYEDVIRVMQKKNPEDPDFIKINELVINEWGQPTKRNSLQDAGNYDIVFEDSWQSPTVREKTRKQISEMLTASAVQGDPVLNTALWYYYVLMTDAPQDLKDYIRKHSQVIQKEEEQKKAAEAQNMGLEQGLQMQTLADREASATVPAPNGAQEAPKRPEMSLAA